MFISNNEKFVEDKYLNNFALTSNLVLLMGKKFKSNEFTSGRMGEIMGSFYMIQAMDWFNHHHQGKFDGLVKYAKYEEFNKIQNNLQLISENYPIFGLRTFLTCMNKKSCLENNLKISDKMIQDVSNMVSKNIELRRILSENSFEHPKLKKMNDHLKEILIYQQSKDNKNQQLNDLIDEITKVDVFEK